MPYIFLCNISNMPYKFSITFHSDHLTIGFEYVGKELNDDLEKNNCTIVNCNGYLHKIHLLKNHVILPKDLYNLINLQTLQLPKDQKIVILPEHVVNLINKDKINLSKEINDVINTITPKQMDNLANNNLYPSLL
jgi:hypothetical protein